MDKVAYDVSSDETYCRATIAVYFAEDTQWVLNMCMIGILDLLSLKYSKPLNNYKDHFVLIFHRENLSQVTAIEAEHGRAQIYNRFVHRQANEDIDRIVQEHLRDEDLGFLRTMTATEHLSERPSQHTDEQDDDPTESEPASITSNSLDILRDSQDPTSRS